MSPGAWSSSRRRVALISGIALVVLALVVWRPWQSQPDVVANNISQNFRACLAADPADKDGARAADAAWSGMQRAARAGGINAQRYPAPSSPDAAASYLNSLAQRRCGLIVVVGGPLANAAEQSRAANPAQPFLAVGEADQSADEVRVSVFKAVRKAAEAASASGSGGPVATTGG